MKKIFLLVIAIGVIGCLFCQLAQAKRMPAPEVEPVIYKGIKFIAPNTPQKMGYIEAYDIKTNKKVWKKKVYRVFINPLMETDVQWIFISSLSIKDGKLVVINERDKKYKVNIPKKILKEEIQLLQLTIKSDKEVYEVGEEIKIEAIVTNNSNKEIHIDGRGYLVICRIFHQTRGEIQIIQLVVQRVLPSMKDFIILKPNQTLSLGEKELSFIEDKPYIGKLRVEGFYEFIFDGGKYGLRAFTGKIKAKPIFITRVVERKEMRSPWAHKAPYPYENEDQLLVANSYKEEWVESSGEKYPEVVRKTKKVLKEWGRNPDKYEYKDNSHGYEISVSESPNFISVVFYPVGLEGLEQHVEIRMTKKDFMIVSILPGA